MKHVRYVITGCDLSECSDSISAVHGDNVNAAIRDIQENEYREVDRVTTMTAMSGDVLVITTELEYEAV